MTYDEFDMVLRLGNPKTVNEALRAVMTSTTAHSKKPSMRMLALRDTAPAESMCFAQCTAPPCRKFSFFCVYLYAHPADPKRESLSFNDRGPIPGAWWFSCKIAPFARKRNTKQDLVELIDLDMLWANEREVAARTGVYEVWRK